MTQYFITPNLFNLCDLGQQQQHNNRSSEKGISGGLNRISKQFLKIHHDGSYHSFISRQMAIALKRYINTKFSKCTPEFVTEIHKKLLCLHEYNLEVAKVKSKYPRSRQLDDLLIRYIELECECLYNGRNRIDEKQENNVQKRVLKLLHVILFEIYKNNENSIKETRDLCLKTIIKFFVTVRAESCNDNNIINNVITNLIDKLGLLEEINKFKGKSIPFYLDTCLQDPEVSKVRQTLTTSDYESNSSDSDDDFEFSDPPFTCPTTENFSTVSLSDMNAIDLSDDEDSFNHIKFKHKPKTVETTSQVKAEIEQFNPIMNNISTDPISILSDDEDDDNNTDNEARNNLIMNQENLSNGASNKLTEIKVNNKCDNNDDNNNSNSSYQNMVNTSHHNSQIQLNGNFDNLQQTQTNPTFADSFLTNEQSYTNLSNSESGIFTITLDDDDFDIHKLNTQLTSNEKHYMPIPILDCDQIKTEVNDEDRSPNLSVINGQVNSNIVQQTTTLERVNTTTQDMERLQSNSANQPLELEVNAEHSTSKEIHEKSVEIIEAVNSDDSENVIISQKNVEDTVETTKMVNSGCSNCKNVTISQENVEGTIETTEMTNNDDSNRENVVISEKNVEDIIETTKTANNDNSNRENVTSQKNVEDIIETTKTVNNDDSNHENVVISQKDVMDTVETIKTVKNDDSNHENVLISQKNIEDTIGTTKTVGNDNSNSENVVFSQKNVEDTVEATKTVNIADSNCEYLVISQKNVMDTIGTTKTVDNDDSNSENEVISQKNVGVTKTVKNNDSNHEKVVISQKNIEDTIGTTKTVDNDDFNNENVVISQTNVKGTDETTKTVKNDDSDHENVISQKNIEDTIETTKTVNIDDSNCDHLVTSQKNVENTVEITKTVNSDNFNFENLIISENLEQMKEIVALATIETTENADGAVATIENVDKMTENPETREHTLPENSVRLIQSVELVENVEVDDVKNCENNEDINKLTENADTQAEIIEKVIEDTDKVVQKVKNVDEEIENVENIENMLENDENGKKIVDVETVEKVDVDFENSEENSAVDEFIDRITEIIDNMSENGEIVDKAAESCETETLTNTEEITDGICNTEIKMVQEVENTENVNSIEIETIDCVEKIIQHVEHTMAILQGTNNGNEIHENVEETMENTANNETIDINSGEEMIEVFEKSTDIGNEIHENVEETVENTTNNETIGINSGEEMIEAVEQSIDIEITSNNITETLVEEHENIEKLPENCMPTDNSTLEEHFTDIQVSGREEIINVTIKETEMYPEIPSSEITGDTVIAHEICIESEIIDENSQNSQSTSNETVEDNCEEEEKILNETDVENINEKLSENSNISTATITESQSTEDATVNDQNNHEIVENITEVHENDKLEDSEHLKEDCKQQQIKTTDNLVEICENEKLENTEKSDNFTQDNQVETSENLTKIDQNSVLEDTKELDDVDQKSQPVITANSTQVTQNEYLENAEESLQIIECVENQTETIDNSIGALQNNQIENAANLTEINSSTPIDVADKDQLENTEISPNINQEDQTKSNEDSTEILQSQQLENMEQPVEILNENEKNIIEEKSTEANQPEIINGLVTSEQNLEIVEDSNKEVSKNQLEINGKVADDIIIESSTCEEISVAETFDKTSVQPEIINEAHHIESIHHEKPRNNRTFTYESTQSSTLNEVEYIDPTHNLGVLATTAVAIADSSTTVTSLSQKSTIINESVNTSTSKRRRSKVRLRRQKVDISNENKRITRNSVNKNNNNNNTKNNQLGMVNSSKSNRHSTDVPVTTTATTKCLAHDFISTENSSIPPQINHVYAQKRLVEANTTSEDSNDSSESTLFIDESNEWKNDKVNERNSNSVYEDETEDDCLKFIDTELDDDDNDDDNNSGEKVTQAEKRCDEIVENKNDSSVCISIPENNDSNQFADNGVLKQMEDFVETQIEIVEQIEDNQDQEISFDRNEIVHKKFDHEKFIKEKTAQQVDDKLRDNNNKTPTDHSIKHILNNVNEQNIKESTVDNNKEGTSSKLKENDENSIINPAIIILEDRIIKTKGALKAFDQEKENTATLIENCFESGKDSHRKIIRSRSKSCNQIVNDNVKDKINFNDDFSITKNSKLVTDLTTLKNSKIQIKESIILNVETKQINEEVLHADLNKNESDGLLDLSIGDGDKTSDGVQEKIEEAPISTTILKDQIEIVEKTQGSSNKTPKDNLTDSGEQDEIVLNNNSKIHEEKLETKVAEVRKLELCNDTTVNNVSLKPQHKKSPTRNKGKSLENTIKKMKERAIKEKNSSEQAYLLDEISKFEEESSSPNLNSSFIETKTEKSLSRKQGKTSIIDDKSQSPKSDRKSSDGHHRSTRSSKSKTSNSKQRESDKRDDSRRSRSSSKSIEIMTERSRSRSRSSSKSKTSNNKQRESNKKDDCRRSRSSSKSIEIMTERSRSRSKSKSKSNNNNNQKEQKRSSRSKSKEHNNRKAHSTEKERSKTPSKRCRTIDKDKVNNNHADNREERSHSKSKDTKSHKDIDRKKVDVKERGKNDKSLRNSPADTNNDDDKTGIDLNKLRDDLKKSLSKSHGQVNKQKNETSHSKEKSAIDSDKGKREKLHKSHKNGDKIKQNLDDNKKNEEKSEKLDQKTKHKMDHNIKKNGDKGEQLDQKTKKTVIDDDGKKDKDKYEKVDVKAKTRVNESNQKTEIKDTGSTKDEKNENMKKNEETIEKSNEKTKQKIDENKPNNEGVEIKKSDKPKEKGSIKETSNDERTTKQQAKDNGETNQKKKTSIDQIFEEAFKRAELERKSKQQQQIVDNEQNKDKTNKELQNESETIKISENEKMRKRQSTDSIELETEEYKRQKLIDNSKESQNNIQEDMQIEKLDHGKIIVNIQPPLPPPLPLSTPPLPPPPPLSPPPPPPPLPTSPPPPPPPLPPDIVDETKTPNETQVIKNNLQVLPTTSKTISKTTNNENFEQIDGIVTPGTMELESPTKILLTNDIQTTDTFFVNNTFSTSCNLNMQVLSSTVDTTVKDFPTTETVTSTNLQTSVSIHCGVIAQSVNLVNTTQDPTNIPNDKNCLFTFSNDTTTPTSTVTNSSNLTTLNDLEQMELIAAPHHTHSHHHHHHPHHHHRTTHVMVSLSDSIDVVQNNPPVVETEVEIQSIQDYDGSFNLGGPMVSGRREEKTITTPTDLTLNDSSPDEFPLTSEELELSFNDNNLIDDYFNPCKTEKPDFDNTIIIDTNDTITTKTDEIQNSIKDLNYLIGITQSDEQIKNDDDDDNDNNNNNNNDNDVEDVDDVSSNSNSTDTDDQTINNRPPTDSINDATLYAVNNLISLGSGESSSETHTFTSISDIDIMESSKESLNSLNTAIPSTSTTPDIVTKPTYSSDYLSNQSNENHSTITPNNNDDTNSSNKNNDIDNNCVDNDDGVEQKVIVQKIEQAPMSIDILEKAYINNCKPTPSSTCSSSSSSSTSSKNNVSKFIQSVKRNETTKKNESNVNDVMEKFTGRKHNRTPVSAPRRNQQKPVSSSKTSPQNDLSNDNSNNKEVSHVPELRIRVKKDLGATLFDTDLLQQEQQQQKSEIPSQRHSYAVENLLNLRTNDTESQQSTSDNETSRKRKHLYDDYNSDGGEKRRRKSDDSIDDREKRNNEIFDKLLKQGPINKCMLTQNYETKPIALLSSSASTSSSASSSSAIIINTRTKEMLARSRADNERQVQRQYYPPPTTTVITTAPPIITTLQPSSLLLPPPPLAASSSSSSITTSASHSQTLQHYPGGSSSSSNGSTSSGHNRREGVRHRHEGTRQRITSYPRNLDRRSSTEPVSKTSKWYVKPLLMHSVTRSDRSHSHIRPDDRRLSATEANSKRQTYGETVRNPRLQKDEDKFLWLQKCSGIFDSPPLFEVPENN